MLVVMDTLPFCYTKYCTTRNKRCKNGKNNFFAAKKSACSHRPSTPSDAHETMIQRFPTKILVRNIGIIYSKLFGNSSAQFGGSVMSVYRRCIVSVLSVCCQCIFSVLSVHCRCIVSMLSVCCQCYTLHTPLTIKSDLSVTMFLHCHGNFMTFYLHCHDIVMTSRRYCSDISHRQHTDNLYGTATDLSWLKRYRLCFGPWNGYYYYLFSL